MYRLILLALIIAGMLAPPHVHAYIDPGTGSYFFQILLASTLGLAFSVKLYWKQLITFFKRTFSNNKHDHTSTEKSSS